MIDNLTEAISHAKKVAMEKREEEQALRDRRDFIESNERNPKGIYDVPINQCKECASEHEQLADWLTELQERREADRWIPVSEKLPEPRVAVMVYCPEHKNQYCAFYEDKHWQVFGAYDTVWAEVTHWKPLPKAPESEDK